MLALERDSCNVKDVVKGIIHDTGLGVLLVKVLVRDTYKLVEAFVSVEDTYKLTLANSCTVEPRLSRPSTVASQSARWLKVPSSHLCRRKIALT